MRGPLRPDMQIRRPNPGNTGGMGTRNHSDVGPDRHEAEDNPVVSSDAEVYQAEADTLPVLPVRMVGPVQTQAMPTVSAGSRNITIAATGGAGTVLCGSADPRRASLTIITNQPTYISSSKAQVDLGTAALIPANVGVVITHRQEVYVGGPATNTYPMTVAVMQENWAY